MRRRSFFWLAVGIALLIPFLMMTLMASFSVTEFVIISGVIIVVAVTLAGGGLINSRLTAPIRAGGRPGQPAVVLGLGLLVLILLGGIVAFSLAGSTVSTTVAVTATPIPETASTAEPRTVNPMVGFVIPLVTVILASVAFIAMYLFVFRKRNSPPTIRLRDVQSPDQPADDAHTLDWQEMLSGDEEEGDDGGDVSWWVQKLTKHDPKR